MLCLATWTAFNYHQECKIDHHPNYEQLRQSWTNSPSATGSSPAIVFGDFNCVLQGEKRAGCRTRRHDKTSEQLKNMMADLELQEVWKKSYPNDPGYTWSSNIMLLLAKSMASYRMMFNSSPELNKDALSPLLFICAFEPLLSSLGKDKVIRGVPISGGGGQSTKICAYMDDVSVLCTTEAALNRTVLNTDIFCTGLGWQMAASTSKNCNIMSSY
ncbi:uncharacterized protein [Pyxicephalus adspersus]|uniref:uncharacterized protein n=1 Tax=Pyxicephalus adspersus TaxID=30357 RepID=UPI003B5C650C